jgi:hypothetical protein
MRPVGILHPPAATPEQKVEIRRRIRGYAALSFVGLAGLIAQAAAFLMGAGSREGQPRELSAGQTLVFLAMWFGGTVVYIAGLSFAALSKGRSGWFGLFGFLSCIGLLILHFMAKHCLNCPETASNSAKHCLRCGAPL